MPIFRQHTADADGRTYRNGFRYGSNYFLNAKHPSPTGSVTNAMHGGRSYLFTGSTGSVLRTYSGSTIYDPFACIGAVGDIDKDNSSEIACSGPDGIHIFSNAVRKYVIPLNIDQTSAGSARIAEGLVFGDVNGDGISELLLSVVKGTTQALDEFNQTYTVLLREVQIIDPVSKRTLHRFSTNTLDEFGYAIANVGDLDGNSKKDFCVGAPEHRLSSNIRGKVYCYLVP